MAACGSGSAPPDPSPARAAAPPPPRRGALVRALLGAALGPWLVAACAPEAHEARLGDLVTEGGEVIRDCRVVYRTFGALDPAGSNAVLVAPWFLGTSRELAAQIGPGRLVDSSRFFVIAVDALGNGVSTSPSTAGPAAAFPRLTTRDLVAAEHALVTRVLGLERLRAVVGTSMGGMQALAWATAYPGFADSIVSIQGSPRSTPRDRDGWRRAVAEVRAVPGWRRAAGALGRLDPRGAWRALRIDPEDYAAQADAIATHDVTAALGGSLAAAAAVLPARTLLVVSARDEIVDPEPSRELARLGHAELLVLPGRCGHDASRCERGTLVPAVARFLEGSGPADRRGREAASGDDLRGRQ